MSKLYACIISADAKKDKEVLLSIARRFSYSIEMLEDGVLFDVSGLQRLVGAPQKISQKIFGHLKKSNIPGSIAVADTVDTAVLLAHQNVELENISEQAKACTLNTPETFQQLPLENLQIEEDTLNVFNDLGIRRVEELLQIPEDELVNRYG